MSIFKKILIGIGSLIVLILIAGIFVSKDLSVEREIIINKPRNEVYDYVKYLKNQDNFSNWATMDPGMEKAYSGQDGTVGFRSAWRSANENVGEGEQTITAIVPGERIDYDLHFIKPMESFSRAHILLEDAGAAKTRVRWGFTSQMNYPFNLMKLFMNMEEMVGNDLQKGLQNLKNILEK